LRVRLLERAAERGWRLYFPSRALSTDNAAMIAAAAHLGFLRHRFADTTLNAKATLPLA